MQLENLWVQIPTVLFMIALVVILFLLLRKALSK